MKRWLYALRYWLWFSAHYGYNKRPFSHGALKYKRRQANFRREEHHPSIW